MILSFLFYGFLLYLLFKLVVNFIIPLYRTTRKVKQSFREMRQKMEAHQAANGYESTQSNTTADSKNKPVGDYIDFEEVKE